MLKKITIIFLIVLIVTIGLPNKIQAALSDDVIEAGDDFLDNADPDNPLDEAALKDTSEFIYNAFFSIAVVLAVAVGVIIGIQFIMGSIEEKAKVKETLIPYIVGVFVVFASFTIWKIAITIGNDVTAQQNLTHITVATTENYKKEKISR